MKKIFRFKNLGSRETKLLNHTWSWLLYATGPRYAGPNCPAATASRLYWDNENKTNPKKEIEVNLNAAFKFIKDAYDAAPEPKPPVDLYGYSRGGMTAIMLAKMLKDARVPVRFLGLLDPSATGSGLPVDNSITTIPPNVARFGVIYAEGEDTDLGNSPGRGATSGWGYGKWISNFKVSPASSNTKGRYTYLDIGHIDLGTKQSNLAADCLWNYARWGGVDSNTLPDR